MIFVNCHEIEGENDSYIQIDLDVRYDDPTFKNKIVEDDFEEKIIEAINRKKKIVFSIRRLDNDGFIAMILKFWRRKSNNQTILVKTNEDYIRGVLETTLRDWVEFV